MIRSSFFNSIAGDRKYNASKFAEYFGSFIGNGVFPAPINGLQVIEQAAPNMTVIVKAGKVWIDGYIMINDDDYILSIDPADGLLNRIDRLVARLDTVDREIRLEVKKGTFASNPIAPSLQRDADAYELGLADVYVSAGVVSIIKSKITDLRGDTALCGKVDSLIAGDINSLAAALNEHKENFESHIDDKDGHRRIAIGDIEPINHVAGDHWFNNGVPIISPEQIEFFEILEKLESGGYKRKYPDLGIKLKADETQALLVGHGLDTLVNTTTPTKMREAKIMASGTVRVKFSIGLNSGIGPSYGRVYINDVPVGAIRSMNTTGDTAFTQDFTVNAGDLISIYGWTSTGSTARCRMTSFILAYILEIAKPITIL